MTQDPKAKPPQETGPGGSGSRRPPPQPLRWVVSDVDGTIVNHNKEVTAPSIAAAQRLRQRGIGLTIASSRPPWGMRHVADALAITGPIAGFNGAVIVDQAGAVLHEARIPRNATQAALAMLADEGVSAWVFTSSHWFILDPDGPHVAHERRTIRSDPAVLPDFSPWLDQACKIVGASDDLEHLADVATRMAARLGDQANAGLSQKYYLDVTPPGVSKGSVVSYVAGANAIASASIAAIGDMDNDIAMFGVAGYAIGMGNGSPAVLAAADVITLSNDDDGFAAAINTLLDGAPPA